MCKIAIKALILSLQNSDIFGYLVLIEK